ncbi:CHAT domain-containing protein [Arthrobacter sp. NPDC057009]|uniref:CHAT domain-containing protein n=1 Tax=Arthrobacter sp. NPDC057009 TaxID=3345996 RepID=UPI00362C43FB
MMPQHAYLDFDLLFEPTRQGGYQARVLKSPAGEVLPVPVKVPFSDLELENFLLRVGRPRRQVVRGIKSPEAAAVLDFGAKLFDAVFKDRLRSALTTSLDHVEGMDNTGLRVRLRLSDCPELADLPWEYLYHGDLRRYLALSEWTPVVRYLELQGRIRPLAVDPPLRILVMASSPSDFEPLDALAEWNKIRQALDGLQQEGLVQLDRVPVGSLADLRRNLMTGQYHVFHFIGHGRYDSEGQDGVLALEDRAGQAHLVSGTDIGAILHDHKSLRLVVLNACEGARGGLRDPYSGVAQSLIYQGIPAVVAMQFEITDRAAIAFAQSLYETVANGYPLDAAMAAARNAIRDEPNPLEWATPVLYLRAPDGRIFDVPQRGHPGTNSRVRLPIPEPIQTPSPSDDGRYGPPTRSGDANSPDEHAIVSSVPNPVSGTPWAARGTRLSKWKSDWRVEVTLTQEKHSIEFREGWRKGNLSIDGVQVEESGLTYRALRRHSYKLSDGDKIRSLRLAGSWFEFGFADKFLEIWIDEQLLLRMHMSE